MPYFIKKLKIKKLENNDKKISLITSIDDKKYLKDVIEGKKDIGLDETFKLKLIEEAGLQREVLTDEIKVDDLTAEQEIALIKSGGLEREALTGRIKIKLDINEKLELVKSAGLEREVLSGDIFLSLTTNEKVALVKRAGLEKEVVLGKISLPFLGASERIEMVLASGLVLEVLTGEIDFLDNHEKVELAGRANLSREVIVGEIQIEGITDLDKLMLARDAKTIKEILLGKIKIDVLPIDTKIDLVRRAGLEREVLSGEIEIEGLTESHKFQLAKSGMLYREALLGLINLEELPDWEVMELIEEAKMEKEVLTGQIKIEKLEIWQKLRIVRSSGLVKEVLAGKVGEFSIEDKIQVIDFMQKELESYIKEILDGKIEVEGFGKEEILECVNCYVEDSKKQRKLEKMDAFDLIDLSRNNLMYLYVMKKVIDGEIEPSKLQIDGINDLMKLVEVVGPDVTYSLVRYYSDRELKLDFSEVIANPDVFNKFREYSKDIFVQQPMDVKEIRSSIERYNGNPELIADCMSSELNDEDKKLFVAVLKEKCMEKEIKSKEELRDFPEKRKDKIAKMIDEQNPDAITYLLTGMEHKTYKKLVSQYLFDKQIERVLENFSQDENKIFQKIKAINQVIELIEHMDENDRRTLLHDINNDLANEFTIDGSEIAAMRQAFIDADVELKRLYGKELAHSLAEVELPVADIDEELGVEVIKLDGQEFTLLIHTDDKTWGTRDNSEVRRTHMCASLISQDHLDRYENDGNLCYAFRNISANSLIMEGSVNLCSNLKIGRNSVEVDAKTCDYDTAQGILDGSEKNEHNEVDLWYEYSDENGNMVKLMPDYLVVFDEEIDPVKYKDVIDEAKRLSIPIIVIDENRYKEKMSLKEESRTEESRKIRPKDIYVETMSKLTEMAPALTQEVGMQVILDKMERERENIEKGGTHDGR